MKTIAIMPIKLQNERLPGKNTMPLGDKPLLQYQLLAAKETGLLDALYVYCSDEAVCPFLPEGAQFLKRPAVLDLPTSNFTQIFSMFSEAVPADIYVYVHATAPFIRTETIRECIEAVQNGEYDSAFCAVKIRSCASSTIKRSKPSPRPPAA